MNSIFDLVTLLNGSTSKDMEVGFSTYDMPDFGLNISEHPSSFLSDDYSVRMLAGMIKGEHVQFFLNVAMENHHVQNFRTKSALVHIEIC